MPWRAEWGRQLRRRRTLWSFALLVALPLVIVAAFSLGDGPVRGSTRFVDLAQLGAANFAAFIMFVSAEFLLVVLAALFAGDSVPSEASWSSLRYLLTAPVPRARLLTSKLVVGVLTMAAAVVFLLVWSLLVGGTAYGWAPLTSQAGGAIPWATLLPRLVLVVGYLVISLMQAAAIAFWIGCRTDAPLAAVGGAVLAAILFGILGQVDALGDLRNAMPFHYDREWLEFFSDVVSWDGLRHGLLWSTLWSTVFVALGYREFRRKDILS